MTQTNVTSEIEYCDDCGSMVVTGVCRRCNPDYRDPRKTTDTRTKGMEILEGILDAMSIEYETTPNRSRCDYRFANGRTAMIRTLADKNTMLNIANGSLHTIKTDTIILVSDVNMHTPRVYIIPKSLATRDAADRPRSVENGYGGESEYILDKTFYEQYRDRYDLIGAHEQL